ncbi:SDR family oxidoreductase [Limibaculum sp. M0105]|uniref:SDR family oxidoreductase n=1 Tax=Thermohalobaculum xanthum TaxID=2753746 RepID=A0A8J7SCE3_9RHOB|nr:SDR family oxidoreductase [Thermohalobaculum xanthum]MBK0398206.1 SDR family oxidoreductase [Thermohalobaculum xanthum]
MRGTVLIAGATGVIGQAAMHHFAALGGWQVLAISRRAPEPVAGVTHLPLDLTDARACREALSGHAVTHVVYAALYEKPDLVAGWRDPEQMAINLAMLRNLVEPLGPQLAHVSLFQGTKAYGVHIRPFPVPARESWPRHDHENFYWLQEDWLKARAAEAGFATTIFRPQVVFGDATGVAMNLTPVIGIWAAICKAEGRAFAFPGGPPYLLEAVDADLIARALAWAAGAETARGETFNITNGDVMVWQNVWPAIADALGVAPGPDEPLSLAGALPQKEDLWQEIVSRHGLRPASIRDLVGHSHHYADFVFAHGVRRPPAPALVSTIKLRQAGFHDCIDTEAMFRAQIAGLQERRIIPPRDSKGGTP